MEQTANESYQQVREPPARHAWCVAELKHCNNETWSTALIRCLWSWIVDQTTAALSGDWQTDGTALPYLFRVGRSFELASQLTQYLSGVWCTSCVTCAGPSRTTCVHVQFGGQNANPVSKHHRRVLPSYLRTGGEVARLA